MITQFMQEQALLACFQAAGFIPYYPPILQPASIFLDLSGEDIRGHLFLTQDHQGEMLCLRPEFTIPITYAYLESSKAGQAESYAYYGPVFRSHASGKSQFTQAGMESFGRTDRAAADAEILALTSQAIQAAKGPPLVYQIGDLALFNRLLEVLDFSPPWRRRLWRGYLRGARLDEALSFHTQETAVDHSGMLAVLEGVDHKGASAAVQDLLSIAGISAVGGRTIAEIADRFLEQASLRSSLGGMRPEKSEILRQFLAIKGEPDVASRTLRTLAQEAHLDMGAVLDFFDTRLHFMAACGLDMETLTFAASFGRHLDYYTGFIFEGYAKSPVPHLPIVGGGRYDALLKSLGARQDIPAVGAAIWCDRLLYSTMGEV